MAFRLRLKFQKHILSESQQLDGLKRSWMLVDPGDRTISDLICHLIETFNLYDSCPNGILLTMDGFVLPPFESIDMLKDAEVICVKRKGAKLADVVQGKEGETDLLEHNVEQKQQPIPGLQLLANGKFVQETGGYQSETDEDDDEAQSDAREENMAHVHVPAKKRKASEEPSLDAVHAKKRKVPKEPKNTNSLNKDGEATVSPYSQSNRSGQSRSAKRKKIKRQMLRNLRAAEKEKFPQEEEKADLGSDDHQQAPNEDSSAEGVVPAASPKEEEKADSGSEKEHISNADDHQQAPDEDSSAEDEVVRVASRSARRKKATRQWIRSILASKEKQVQSPRDKQKADSRSDEDKNLNTDDENSPEEEEKADSESEKEHISTADDHQQAPDEDSSTEDEVVRVTSRSSRRKKAKRQRIRAIKAAEDKQTQSSQDKQKADSRSDEDKNLNTDDENFPEEEEETDSESEKEHISTADDHQQAPDEDSSAEDEVVRVASRSSRRKKAKRQRIRAIKAAEDKQTQSSQDKQKADSRSDEDKNLNTYNQQQEPDDDEDSDTDGEAVPVTIRPGHILFASPGKVREVEQHKEVKESFNWSGTMNKRKGQKWGSQLQTTTSKWNENGEKSKWNENRTPHENQSATERNGHRSPKEKQSKSWQNDHTVPDRNCAADKVPVNNASIDYEKLLPLTDSPVKGDIIAYRLVELSSSFCPELTAFRVGKVSCFDSESNKIMLSPLPQYPFEFKKSANDDEDYEDELPDTTVYNEDGSLEIEFQSLVDARVVERGVSASAVVVQHKANGAPASGSFWTNETPKGKGSSTQAWPIKVKGMRGNKSASSQTETSSSDKPSPQPQPTSINLTGAIISAARTNPENNGSSDAWEEITAALSAKKAELSKWNKNQSSAKRPWSYRAMRKGALGPTLALLRTQNAPEAN